jgi:hypothetical protein
MRPLRAVKKFMMTMTMIKFITNEPGGGDDSIIRMYTDWKRGSEDSEGIIDV